MPGDAAVAVDYSYEVIDNDGVVLADLPLAGVRFKRVLSRYGDLAATLPLTHASGRRSNVDPPGREIVVTRNNSVVWNGPITRLDRDKSSQLVTIQAQDLLWYLYNARLEVDYSATSTDLFDIVRDLVDIATDGDGARFSFTVSAGSAGVTKTVDYQGAFRYSIGQLIQDLASDPTDGFDFRLDLAGSGGGDITRQLTLGAPSLGTLIEAYKLEPGNGMDNLHETLDIERGGNRVHLLPGLGATLSLTNAGSLAAGDPLLHHVLNRPELDSASDAAAGVVQDLRRLAQPPVRSLAVAYRPRAAVPYDWCNLADSIGIEDDDLQLDETRRVMEIETVPPQGQHELVSLSLGLPLDELGT